MRSYLVLVILYASCAINGQRPEDRCQDVGAGNKVCFSCTSVGTCKEDPSNLGKFTIEEIENCSFTGDFCDKDEIDGECFPQGPDSQCRCQIDDECINDPNNENVITVCNPEVVELQPCDVPPAKGECVCPEGSTSTTEGTTPSEASTPAPNGPTNSNGRPEERCTASGDMVCLSCNSVGSCIELYDGSFVVQPQETCFDPELCDSDFSDGTCLPLDASSTNCFCTGKCRVDINNPLALFLCATGENILCPIAVDINTCECTDSTPPPTTTTTTLTTTNTDPTTPTPLECPSCGYLDFSETDCPRYFYCGGGGMIPGLCPEPACFNPIFCTCDLP